MFEKDAFGINMHMVRECVDCGSKDDLSYVNSFGEFGIDEEFEIFICSSCTDKRIRSLDDDWVDQDGEFKNPINS